jgi:serine/threonine protein phosphatase PrpC
MGFKMKILKLISIFIFLIASNIYCTDVSNSSDKKQLAEKAFCCAQILGSKNTQEDRFTMAEFEGTGYDFFGVYDGHGGEKISERVKQKLHLNILNSKEFLQDNSEGIKFGFVKTHNDLSDYFRTKILESQGSTAVVMIIGNGKINIGWTGDSRIVLYSKSNKYWSSTDHTLKNEIEKARLKYDGAQIKEGTHRIVNTKKTRSIIPSRVIGDYGFPGISCVPETFSDSVNKYEFAIMASDGLWDILSCTEAIIFVKENLSKFGIKATTQGLIEFALAKATERRITTIDNITAIIVNCANYEK